MKIDIALQTKQVLSQVQMQSLNILAMSMTELQEFLQKEEIENPLVEYTGGSLVSGVTAVYRDHDQFYNRVSDGEEGEHDLYEGEISQQSVEDMIIMQLAWDKLTERRKRIVEFCVHSLDQKGFLAISVREIAKHLREEPEVIESVLAELKTLEPRGIFASGLEECLALQIQGMEQERFLEMIIKNHLQDVAEGKISNISRALKVSTIEVRKMIQVIKGLNPRPLNGYGEERVQYIFPDIILTCHNNQWAISLNDQWTGSIGINEFYVHMLETAQDEELRQYFEKKLQRARQIVNAVEQRRKTLIGISEEIIKRQAGYLIGKEPLKAMTLEEIASEREIHVSTVSRAIRDKYILAPMGCLLIRDLFTAGISSGEKDGMEISRNAVKEKLKKLVDREDKRQPYSDEQLAKLLKEDGMSVSRRTVAKYRMEMGIGGTFQRRVE